MRMGMSVWQGGTMIADQRKPGFLISEVLTLTVGVLILLYPGPAHAETPIERSTAEGAKTCLTDPGRCTNTVRLRKAWNEAMGIARESVFNIERLFESLFREASLPPRMTLFPETLPPTKRSPNGNR